MNLYSDKYFYTMSFTFVNIRIIIILVGFLIPFAVCITIKTIPDFSTWDYSPLLFRILLCSFIYFS